MMADNGKQEKSNLDTFAMLRDKKKMSELDSDRDENKENNLNDFTSEEKANEESLKKRAFQLLLQGKRNILICDFQAAVAALGESLKLFVSLYDEQADELGDPYFYYGKALFELARNESEVLGDQVQDEEDDCDEEDEDNEENDDNEDDKDDKDSVVENNSGTKSQADEVNNKETNSQENVSKELPTGERERSFEEEAENVNDLQLSWENLELAKIIYHRKAHECKNTAIKLAEVYLTLGENGLESENYRLAIEDMKQALKIQQNVLPEEDRRIAETFYHLGIANSLERNFDEAISCFNSAIKQLQKKVSSLKARKEAGDNKTEEEERDAFYTTDGEIEDILSVIKDIEEKIVDMNDFKNQMKEELLKQVVSGGNDTGNSSSGSSATSGNSSATSGGTSASPGPITDISHLVRKKRKNENDVDINNKRPKAENGL